MKLKYQLLFLALISFIFPISGYLALKTVDEEFRNGIQQAAKATLSSLQAAVHEILSSKDNIKLNGFVAEKINSLNLDGEAQEWSQIKAYHYTNGTDRLQVKIAQYQQQLALLISNSSAQLNATSRRQKPDELIIALANDQALYRYTFKRVAEGFIRATETAQELSTETIAYTAYWHETSQGFQLEMWFVPNNFHHLGLVSINNTATQTKITGTLQPKDSNRLKLLPMVSNNTQLQSIINRITPENNQFTLKDRQGRIIAQSNKLPKIQNNNSWQWLLTPVYQWLFAIDNKDNWFYRNEDGLAGVILNKQHENIVYSLKSMMPQGQQNMIQSLLKAGIIMLLVVFIILVLYLTYASILAWRIRTLNHALQKVLDAYGKVHTQLPSNTSRDEIGQLARGIESMLKEMQEYTQYLKDLGSRLSHEMKTPIAIVQSSLDNLLIDSNHENTEFLNRAKHGTNRLKFILNQLSELNSLKLTLEKTKKQRFNLTKLCTQLGTSYQSILPNLSLSITNDAVYIKGSAELMAQLLDKLIENAQDFTPNTGTITLQLLCQNKYAELNIINSGSQLPAGINVFDSMTTHRLATQKNTTSAKTHLGLGLYIVQLISRFHLAKIQASNLKNPEKVKFSLKIPKI